MTIRGHLREADPLARESGMSAADVQAMRRAVVTAAPEVRDAAWSPRPMMLAATVGFTLVMGVVLGTWFLPHGERLVVPANNHPVEHRQVQFETRGGTRVIWVLRSDFGL